eukprot:scaffold32960_cov58-Phaeocystis_antarctica.AAC.2
MEGRVQAPLAGARTGYGGHGRRQAVKSEGGPGGGVGSSWQLPGAAAVVTLELRVKPRPSRCSVMRERAVHPIGLRYGGAALALVAELIATPYTPCAKDGLSPWSRPCVSLSCIYLSRQVAADTSTLTRARGETNGRDCDLIRRKVINTSTPAGAARPGHPPPAPHRASACRGPSATRRRPRSASGAWPPPSFAAPAPTAAAWQGRPRRRRAGYPAGRAAWFAATRSSPRSGGALPVPWHALLGRYEIDVGKLLHRSTTAAVAAATDHGDPKAKPAPRVALKAMREAEQVCAELKGRVGLAPGHVVAIKAVYADEEAIDAGAWDTVVSAAAGLEGVVLKRAPGLSLGIQAHLFPSKQEPNQASATAAPGAGRELWRKLSVRTLDASSEYKLLIVLELADRTLKHTIDHEHIAGKDWPAIRHIATDLAEGLDNVHAKGGIHADLKPLNAVGDKDRWKIIDFDVFCTLGEPFGNKVPSSGYCPPEMAKVLLAATNKATGEVDTPLLKEYIASKEYDLWSFGVVLYQLCFGTPLWKTDTDDNITLSDLNKLAAGSDAVPLRKVIDKALYDGGKPNAPVDLAVATALLRKLLEPVAQKRLAHFESAPTCMQGVLDEPFFQSQRLDAATLEEMLKNQEEFKQEQAKQTALLKQIDERTISIEGLQRATITKMDKHASSLRACIQAAVDDTVPTAFVILSHSPGPPEQDVFDEVAAEVMGGDMLSLYHRGASAIGTLKGVISNPMAFAFAKLKEHAVDTLFLSLVCEACWMPQEGAYEITVQGDTCQTLMPIAKATLSTVNALNGIAGLAQCFFPGLPSIPKNVMDKAQATINELDVESSVAEFDEVQSLLAKQDGEREQGKQDGYCRRQFMRLLKEKDPDNNWAKLKRAILAEGKSIWMCKCCADILGAPGNKDKSYEELRGICKPQALKDFEANEVAPEIVSGSGAGGESGGGEVGGGVGVGVGVGGGGDGFGVGDCDDGGGDGSVVGGGSVDGGNGKGSESKNNENKNPPNNEARGEARMASATSASATCPGTLVICSLQ